MTEKEEKIIDAILRNLSVNFQRSVWYREAKIDHFKDRKTVELATEQLETDLRVLLNGFEKEIKWFMTKIKEDISYKPPEVITDALSMRFYEFRTIIVKTTPKVSCPIIEKAIGTKKEQE